MKIMEEKLTKALLENAAKAQNAGINMAEYIKKLQKLGGLRVCKDTLKRRMYSENFEEMCSNNLASLTMEATVVRSEFAALFSDNEVNFCFEVLCEYGYF